MLEELIRNYGYLAILAGTLLEGETVVLLGGLAAHRGYLDLAGVMAAAFAGSVAGDQLYFEIGRRRGMAFIERRPAWRPQVARVKRLVHRHHTLLIFSFRFLYGIRTVTPFLLGASGVPQTRFAVLNVVSATLWAIAFGWLGYALGNAFETVLGDLRRYEGAAFAAVAAAGVAIWLWRRWRGRASPATRGTASL